MAVQQLSTTKTSSDKLRQLIARNSAIDSRPCVLDAGVLYKRGCLVFGADPNAVFVKVANGALPAATDIIGIVTDEVDLSVDGAADSKAEIYTKGEFDYDTVFTMSSDDLEAADVLAVVEACIKQGINLIEEAYGDFAPAV